MKDTDNTLKMTEHYGDISNDSICCNVSEYYDNATDSNHTDSTIDGDKEFFGNPVKVAFFLIAILALLANIMSIAATLHIPHSLNLHLKLVISLAVSDICASASLITIMLFDIIPGRSICISHLASTLYNCAVSTSLMNILAMAIDHYIAIVKPLHYAQIISSFRQKSVLLLLWIVGVLIGIRAVIVALITHRLANETHALCDEIFRIHDVAIHNAVASVLYLLALLELCVLIYLYLRIYVAIRKFQDRCHTRQHDNTHNSKAIITSLFIVGTFFICWIPLSAYRLTNIVLYYIDIERLLEFRESSRLEYLQWVLLMLWHFNSLCDPFIYALRLQSIQQGYRRLFGKLCNYQQSRNS